MYVVGEIKNRYRVPGTTAGVFNFSPTPTAAAALSKNGTKLRRNIFGKIFSYSAVGMVDRTRRWFCAKVFLPSAATDLLPVIFYEQQHPLDMRVYIAKNIRVFGGARSFLSNFPLAPPFRGRRKSSTRAVTRACAHSFTHARGCKRRRRWRRRRRRRRFQ